MADILSPRARSELMSKVRARGNVSTELALKKVLRVYRITGWRRHFRIPGVPDFAFPTPRVAIFVDGCFWHGCPICRRRAPSTNREFWQRKIAANVRRDRIVGRELRSRGWRVVRIWEHEVRSPQAVAKRLRRVLRATVRKCGSRIALKSGEKLAQ